MINAKSEGVKVDGYRGRWYVIDSTYHASKKVFLMEHETYGEDTAHLIIDENKNIIKDDVWNGFSDLTN